MDKHHFRAEIKVESCAFLIGGGFLLVAASDRYQHPVKTASLMDIKRAAFYIIVQLPRF